MKAILRGYLSLFREVLDRPNDGAFLNAPASLPLTLVVCAILGLVRNALSLGLGSSHGFYSFQPDIQWVMATIPIHLLLFPAAVLHGLLRILGYRNVAADTLFGLGFHLQLLHLLVPLVDWVGFGLGLPPAYILGTRSIANAWYTNKLLMTPGTVFAWWITAYMVVRVFRKHLRVGWSAIVVSALATFLVILVPTYILFPTFNTLFNNTFGPYLWNPLKYFLDDPRWFPFWGDGTYFMLTAVAGMVYWTKHSQRKDVQTLFDVNSAGRAHAWLLGLALVRSIFDYVWMPWDHVLERWLVGSFNATIYLYLLYLLIPALAGLILGRVFGRPVIAAAPLRPSVLVWIVYPMVSLISIVARSSPAVTIAWFRYIPTFMVENNFLPAGMMAVIPVLIVFYTLLMNRLSGAGWLKSLAAVLIALWVIYLIFYQWTFTLVYYLYGRYGLFATAGYWNLCFLLPMLLLAPRFHEAFGPQRIPLQRIVLAATVVSIGLIAFGLLAPNGRGPV